MLIQIQSVKGKSRNIVKTADDSIPLPDPFPLPKYYSRGVEMALENKTLEHRVFLSDVASSMLRFKRYPSRDDYITVCPLQNFLFTCIIIPVSFNF